MPNNNLDKAIEVALQLEEYISLFNSIFLLRISEELVQAYMTHLSVWRLFTPKNRLAQYAECSIYNYRLKNAHYD